MSDDTDHFLLGLAKHFNASGAGIERGGYLILGWRTIPYERFRVLPLLICQLFSDASDFSFPRGIALTGRNGHVIDVQIRFRVPSLFYELLPSRPKEPVLN